MRRYCVWYLQFLRAFWQFLGDWFQVNSLAPKWLPKQLRQPLVGYLFALLLIALAIVLEVAAVHISPTIDEASGTFTFLVILFIGLNWGAGPCLVATALGTFLLYYLIYPPPFAITHKDLVDILQGGFVLFGGLFVTIAASQREWQRRLAEQRAGAAEQAQCQAEAVAASLAEAQAGSERDRQRLQGVLESLLAMVAALVQPPIELAPSAEGEAAAGQLVSRRLAELTCYALGCQQVCLFALQTETFAPSLLAAVDRSSDQALMGEAALSKCAALSEWMDAGVMLRLRAGEIVPAEAPQLASQDGVLSSEHAHLLIVPIQRGSLLLGLLAVDAPAQSLPHDLALAQAIAKLSALVLEREKLVCERELAQAEALAQRAAARRLELFLGIVSHELKTPLTTILLGMQVMQRRVNGTRIQPRKSGRAPATLQDHMALVYQQGKRLERLVDELLDNSRIEAGQLDVRLKQLDLAALVSEVVEEQRSLTPERTIDLHTLPAQAVLVAADAERLRQVINNYLSNALKYSLEDRSVEVGVEIEQQRTRVWVRDEGPGIPAGQQERVWERFYRVPGVEALSGSGVGLGLGLYINKAIIERHQGQVGIESMPGYGSTFWFTLALEPPGAEACSADYRC